MNQFQTIVKSVRALGLEGEKLAEEFDDLTHVELLEVIIDDSDLEQALGVLDLMAQEDGGESLMAILERWAKNNPDRAVIDSLA